MYWGSEMDSSRLKPRGSRVVIEIDTSRRTFGGGQLEIAEVASDHGREKIYPQVATVVAVSECEHEGGDAMVADVKVGDRVIATKYNGVPIPGLANHKIIKEEFLLAVVEGEGELRVEWGGRGK